MASSKLPQNCDLRFGVISVCYIFAYYIWTHHRIVSSCIISVIGVEIFSGIILVSVVANYGEGSRFESKNKVKLLSDLLTDLSAKDNTRQPRRGPHLRRLPSLGFLVH